MARPHPIPASTCVAELRRVAALMGRDTLTQFEFDRHASMCAKTVCERLGSWRRALHCAGLTQRHHTWDTSRLDTLARALVQTALEIGHVPNCTELERHAGHDRKTLSRPWGGYVAFKRAALAHLLAPGTRLAVGPDVRALLEAEQKRLSRGVGGWPRRTRAPGGSRKRTPLGMRGFRYAPTCEQGVVALFGAVAHDLGFEILHTQAAFPDCIARHKRRVRRIEFEYTSRDFLHHGHAPLGCDLIVCWRHDWSESPLSVLELESAIKQLPAEPQRAQRTQRNNK